MEWKKYPGVFDVSDYESNQNSKIQYGGSNMADQNVKIYLIRMKIITLGFSASLIANSVEISKFKMADQNVKIYLIGMKISTREFSRSLITNQIKIRKFNMADQNLKIYLIGMKIITLG